MTELVRVSLSLEDDLLDKLTTLMRVHGYENRSEFVRDMIRERLVDDEWREDREVVGTINIISHHDSVALRKKLTTLLHEYRKLVLSTTHLHLDPEPQHCIDIVLFRARSSEVREMTNKIKQMKGTLNTTVSMNTTGTGIC